MGRRFRLDFSLWLLLWLACEPRSDNSELWYFQQLEILPNELQATSFGECAFCRPKGPSHDGGLGWDLIRTCDSFALQS